MEQILETAKAVFRQRFGEAPTCAGISPGRVEVLGNHTDYNQGFILAAAIDRYVAVIGRQVEGDTATVYSDLQKSTEQFGVRASVEIDIPAGTVCTWSRYVRGVVGVLQRDAKVPVRGFEACIVGDLPLGSGLSSSAALECATGLFLQRLFPAPTPIGRTQMALLCQRAENQWVGVQCGILDQFTVMHSRANALLCLDCRDLSFSHIPLPRTSPDFAAAPALVLANTNAHHVLADGTYNRLRQHCFQAAAKLAPMLGHPATHLRDVSPAELAAHASALSADELGRACHIVSENDRVQQCRAALLAAAEQPADRALAERALEVLGESMVASHASSRHDFRNSCDELDAMVDGALAVRKQTGCRLFGCRLSGGGFGGCTVNLVALDQALAAEYARRTPKQATTLLCKMADGATMVDC